MTGHRYVCFFFRNYFLREKKGLNNIVLYEWRSLGACLLRSEFEPNVSHRAFVSPMVNFSGILHTRNVLSYKKTLKGRWAAPQEASRPKKAAHQVSGIPIEHTAISVLSVEPTTPTTELSLSTLQGFQQLVAKEAAIQADWVTPPPPTPSIHNPLNRSPGSGELATGLRPVSVRAGPPPPGMGCGIPQLPKPNHLENLENPFREPLGHGTFFETSELAMYWNTGFWNPFAQKKYVRWSGATFRDPKVGPIWVWPYKQDDGCQFFILRWKRGG